MIVREAAAYDNQAVNGKNCGKANLTLADSCRTLCTIFFRNYQPCAFRSRAPFDITVKKLKQPVVPAIDDELAKKLGFEAMDRVRDLITQQIQREYDQMARLRVKRELLDALAAVASFPVPQGMLEAEFAQIWQRVEADRKQGQGDEEDNAMNIGEWLPVTATFSACLQNNHHHYEGLLRLSHDKSEYDFGFITVKVMKHLGLVKATSTGAQIPKDVPLDALGF